MKRLVLVVLFSLGNLSFAALARAGTDRELTYQYRQIWSALIRFLRVDNEFPILEKDQKAGYLLFEYNYSGRQLKSAFELVPTIREKRQFIRVRLRISEMPSYVEGVLLDKFERKLRDEWGDPPPAKRVDEQKPGSAASAKEDAPNAEPASPEAPDEEGEIEVTEEKLKEEAKE